MTGSITSRVYQRFVKDFAAIAKPLYQLTEKTAWSDEAQGAFEELRHRLVTTPTLAFPDYELPFILDTDASNVGIGAVLSQRQSDGSERVIAYGSRTLSRPERRYCVTRRELLAVVTFVQHFRPYLLGREFLLRTDHSSLVWLTNFKQPEGQLARWLECLQEFSFHTVHRPGKKHTNADALSRRPCSQCGREEPLVSEEHVIDTADKEVMALLQERSPQDIRKLQLDDPTIGPLLQAVEKDERLEQEVSARGGPEVRRLVQLWDRLLVEEGLLKRKYDSVKGVGSWTQLVVPLVLREEILQESHAGSLEGHLGEDKTVGKIRERFYWPGIQEDVRQWIRTCPACATRKSPSQHNRAPWHLDFLCKLLQWISLAPCQKAQQGTRISWWRGTILPSGSKHMPSRIRRPLRLLGSWLISYVVVFHPRTSCILTRGSSSNLR